MSEQQTLNDIERKLALGYFDPAWYGSRYEYDGLDTAALEEAFLSKGIWEGHDPGPLFNSRVYVDSGKTGFIQAGTPAFVHYIRTGCRERRWPNPVFNPHVYAYFLGDAAHDTPDLFQHFLSQVRRGLAPTFSTIIRADWTDELADIKPLQAYYRLFSPDESIAGLLPRCVFRPNFYKRIARERTWGNELYDYLLSGWRKGYDPHPLFDGGYYLEMLEKSETLNHYSFDLQTPLEHFAENWSSAPNPSPFFDSGHYNHEANLPETDYRNPFEAFCALDARLKFISPHRKVNFGALGHVVQDSIAGDGRPFEAGGLVALISNLRFETLEREPYVEGQAASDTPQLSVLVLNYNNLEHTILSVFSAVRNSADVPCEFLILDNGSGNWDLHQLERYIGKIPNVRIVRSDRNTYFGEGNNLLIDAARGKYLLFLNNDAYLGKGAMAAMLKVMENTPDCGMVGATLLFPDGTIQEEGGTVPDCGNSVQRSKHLPFDEFIRRRAPDTDASVADYVSAAVAMVPAALINEIGGFDHIFEPFFFEDTDLCRRVRAHGKTVVVSHDAFVVHLENTSTGEYLADGFLKQVNANRLRYADRWLRRPAESGIPRAGSNLVRFGKGSGEGDKPTAVVYTPFPLSVGGGDRYILSVACALSATHSVTFTAPCPTSRTRLAFVMEDLGLRGTFALKAFDDLDIRTPIDLFVAMGNEIAPPMKALGKRSIFHCQFPFPLHRVEGRNIAFLDGYDEIVVNSQFTKSCTEKQLRAYGRSQVPVSVVHPPVQLNIDANIAAYHTDRFGVATLGRFITQEHMKRQDIVLRVLRRLDGYNIEHRSFIAGSLSTHNPDIDYFEGLKAEAQSHISVEANISRARVADILSSATIYMHATGFGISPATQPHYMEHFGITIVEAMSYGCIPLVFDAGGAAEIVHESGVGYTFATEDEALAKIIEHHGLPEETRQQMALKAYEAAKRYSEEVFNTAWQTRAGI